MSNTGRLLGLFLALFMLAFLNNLVLADMTRDLDDARAGRNATGTANVNGTATTVNVANPCINLAGVFDLCLPAGFTADFLANPLVQVGILVAIVTTLALTAGAAMLATGILSGGASSQVPKIVSTVATALILGGIFTVLLLATSPVLLAFPLVGIVFLAGISIYGFFLIYQISMSNLTGTTL